MYKTRLITFLLEILNSFSHIWQDRTPESSSHCPVGPFSIDVNDASSFIVSISNLASVIWRPISINVWSFSSRTFLSFKWSDCRLSNSWKMHNLYSINSISYNYNIRCRCEMNYELISKLTYICNFFVE